MSKLVGKDVDVTVIEVEEEFKKIVLSMSRAEQYHQLQQITLGALMWGEVRRIEEFGAFIGLEGTRISGLLHISNISRSRVETVDVSSAHNPYFKSCCWYAASHTIDSVASVLLPATGMLVLCETGLRCVSEVYHLCTF